MGNELLTKISEVVETNCGNDVGLRITQVPHFRIDVIGKDTTDLRKQLVDVEYDLKKILPDIIFDIFVVNENETDSY